MIERSPPVDNRLPLIEKAHTTLCLNAANARQHQTNILLQLLDLSTPIWRSAGTIITAAMMYDAVTGTASPSTQTATSRSPKLSSRKTKAAKPWSPLKKRWPKIPTTFC